jgi:transposase
MLDALIGGTTDAQRAGRPREGQTAGKASALREVLEGRFDAHDALWIGANLAHIDFLDEQIDRLSDGIEDEIRPFQPAVELLCSMTGIQEPSARCVIVEIGADMSVFPSDKQLASCGGECPGNDRSAGNRRSGRTRSGSKWLDWTLEEAAMSAIRSKNSYVASIPAAEATPRPPHSARSVIFLSVDMPCSRPGA